MPTRRGAAWFALRVWGHVAVRASTDLCTTLERHRPTARLADAPAVAEHRSALWNDGRADEFVLVAGKVENLRIARRAFDGVVVPAGAVLSFWKQLGQPTRLRGFVKGREIRAGCVVPVVAGGLCQLSNALATSAAACGITLVERHGHTARIEPEAPLVGATSAVDATVLWNYVDLRLSAPFDWRIEVALSGQELVVRIRAAQRAGAGEPTPTRAIPVVEKRAATSHVRGCLTCDETRCHRHAGTDRRTRTGTTAVLVNAKTPEFDHYLRDLGADATWYVPWLRHARRAVGGWRSASDRRIVAVAASLGRTLLLHRPSGEAGGRQQAAMRADRWLAASFARRLEPGHTHLVVDQSLLVAMADRGALQGRTYDVLMPALPAGEIQRRLDEAAARWPQAASLRDFRVSPWYVEAELRALRGARRVVTPHAEAARHLRSLGIAQVELLDWQPASRSNGTAATRVPTASPIVAFPASALPRKGALELAEALRHLGWRLLVLGTPSTDAALWRGIEVDHVAYGDPGWLHRADLAALPAHVEHAPRALLSALAHGLPVVATRACGLPASPRLHEVEAGDVPGLIAALRLAAGR